MADFAVCNYKVSERVSKEIGEFREIYSDTYSFIY
jgi:hypothetical protein